MAATGTNDKPFGIAQIRAYIPIILDLNKLNYDTWRELFETHCLTFGVSDHIEGTSSPNPPNETSERTRWSRQDLDCTSRELWLSLENLFRDNKEARALELDHELHTLTMGDLDLTEYCRRLKKTSDLLANIDSPVSERTLVMYLLNGLSEKFDSIINVVKHQTPFPTFAKAQSMLDMEEKRLAKQSKPLPVHTQHSSAPTVLYNTSEQEQQGPRYNAPPTSQHGRGYKNRGRGGRHNRGRGRNNNSWSHQQYNYPPQWGYGPPQWGYGPPHYSPYSPPSVRFSSPQSSLPPPPTSILGQYTPTPPHNEAHLAHRIHNNAPPPSSTQYLPTDIANAFSSMTLQHPGDSTW